MPAWEDDDLCACGHQLARHVGGDLHCQDCDCASYIPEDYEAQYGQPRPEIEHRSPAEVEADAASDDDLPESDEPVNMMLFTCCMNQGGRWYCPLCGKFAKMEQLGSLGGPIYDKEGKWAGHISIYGHLPGFGCNKDKPLANAA